jgi:hypothetical protein
MNGIASVGASIFGNFIQCRPPSSSLIMGKERVEMEEAVHFSALSSNLRANDEIL